MAFDGQSDDVTLLLVRDLAEPTMWIDRWALSYPLVQQVSCGAEEDLTLWQEKIGQASTMIQGRIMAVGHGVGALALMAWLYQCDVLQQRQMAGLMLVSPVAAAWQEDAVHTLARARSPCRAALVLGQDDDLSCPALWASEWAHTWGARLLRAPQNGHLNGALGGWQWGMQLMQEMLLAARVG